METTGYFEGNAASNELELIEKMTTSIVLGTDPDDSGLIKSPSDRALWRKLARSIAAMHREGLAVSYSIEDDGADE